MLKRVPRWVWFLVVGFAVVLTTWVIFNNVVDGDPTKEGPWGDKFGALNCLFAGVGFVAIVATLVYNHDDAEKRDADAKKLMRALDRTAEALEKQATEARHAFTHNVQTMEVRKRALYMDALIARIDGYTRQIHLAQSTPTIEALRKEQDQLMCELSDALNVNRKDARGRAVSAAETEKRRLAGELPQDPPSQPGIAFM